jgi:SAM-dependent methyltransferase
MQRHEAMATISTAPLEPQAHERLGDAWRESGGFRQALACYRGAAFLGGQHAELAVKTALTLVHLRRPDEARRLLAPLAGLGGPDREVVDQVLGLADGTTTDPLSAMDPNRYLRMRSLAAAVAALPGDACASVVDVGGGDGALALFLPDVAYLLVEPDTNGLSGLSLPLPAGAADVVCACHVLEHIPPEGRDAFLDQLLRVARRHVLLLNPFAAAGVDHAARLQLAVDLTGARWAREHLACGLPDLSSVQDYAARRRLTFEATPHGSVGTAFTVTMMNHFARLAGRETDAGRVGAWLNTLDEEHLTSPALPAAWLVCLGKESA